MNRFKIFSRRSIIAVFVVFVLILFTSNIGNVRAGLAGAQALYTAWRFEREVLRATRVGQYYEGLIFKHAPEAVNLLLRDPRGKEKLTVVGENTIPLLNAYMNGKGSSAIITDESMNALVDILDGLSLVGSPSLRKDIQMEYKRFPLDRFVGMNMNEAYVYVLDSFEVALEEPSIVEGTNGKWAYYIHDGVYFEYPSNWYVQLLEIQRDDKSTLVIIPSLDNPSTWEAEWLVLGITSGVSPDAAFAGGFSFNITGYDILWKKPISVNGLNGIEYAANSKMTTLIAGELYDPEKLIFIDSGVTLFDPLGFQLNDEPKVVKERYEYFYHLVESIRIVQP